MSIPEGKKLAGTAFDKFYATPTFDWAKSLPELLAIAEARARAKANSGDVIYDFKDCGSGMLYGVGSQEITAWEMSVLLAEYTAGVLAQKAAEGHCPKEAPCAKASKEFLRMLEDYRGRLNGLVAEIDALLVKIRGSQTLGPQLAKSLGLRD